MLSPAHALNVSTTKEKQKNSRFRSRPPSSVLQLVNIYQRKKKKKKKRNKRRQMENKAAKNGGGGGGGGVTNG